MSKVTKKQLQKQLTEMNVKFNKKATIAQLEKLVAENSKQQKANKRISSKTILRELYAQNKNAAFTLDELVAHVQQFTKVKVNTVETAIIDLKNPKWAQGELLVLTKNKNKQYVVAK